MDTSDILDTLAQLGTVTLTSGCAAFSPNGQEEGGDGVVSVCRENTEQAIQALWDVAVKHNPKMFEV